MLTFEMMLSAVEIEPTRVHLVRHQKSKPLARGTPYTLWRDHLGDFEMYQSLQGTKCFEQADYIASFVVPPTGETLFAGLYKIEGVAPAALNTVDPLSLQEVSGCFLYSLSASKLLDDYIGRLVVTWGAGYIAWHQRAGGGKAISELRLRKHDELFPGYFDFACNLSEIQHLPPTWKALLGSTKGVYLLTSETTRLHYVGSATGAGGFFERWLQHAKAGGDALAFKGLAPSEYRVSILQVSAGFETADDIVRTENAWMSKLHSRRMGLNGHPTSALKPPDGEPPASALEASSPAAP